MPRIGETHRVTTNEVNNEYDDLPPELKGYVSHGVDLKLKRGSLEALAECPYCQREKMHVNVTNGKWHCKTCGEGSNLTVFLRTLYERSFAELNGNDVQWLCEHRGFIFNDTVQQWGLCRSIIGKSGEWLVPGYRTSGVIHNLYRWVLQHDGKRDLYSTEGFNHELAGLNLWDDRKSTVIICEGIWDAMALWEILGRCKWEDEVGGDIVPTGNLTASLLGDINVIAVPSATVWSDAWLPLLKGKKVILAFDSDHPKEIKGTDRVSPSVGMSGMKRIAQSLITASEPPASIHWIAWGEEGYDPNLRSGTDLRDILVGSGDELTDRIDGVKYLLSKVEPIPTEWTETAVRIGKNGEIEDAPLKCERWNVLQNACRKAMDWDFGLEHGMACMLATIASTDMGGDPIWIKVIAPAGGGKTTIAEALSLNRKYTKAVSTIKGMFSGFQTDREGKEDNSLMAQIKDKTLIIKEGDTLLKNSDKDRILSELRDIYDKTARPQFRNKMSREYNQNSTVILCGTMLLRQLDASDLGARFIDVVMMERIDPEKERNINRRVILSSFRVSSMKVNGTLDSKDLPEKIEMKRLASGYINYLREHSQQMAEEINEKVIDDISQGRDDIACRIDNLSTFVSYMRARPSTVYTETVERELPTRLSAQLSRLATYLAVVMNKKSIDEKVMTHVRKVAIDTSVGTTLSISGYLYDSFKRGEEGASCDVLHSVMGWKKSEMQTYLNFLVRIRAIETVKIPIQDLRYMMTVYRLSEELRTLYESVMLSE